MTYELAEIENQILEYLQDVFPQSVITKDINMAFLNKIATRVDKNQIDKAIEELKHENKILIYYSEKLDKYEIKALGSKKFYNEYKNNKKFNYKGLPENDQFFFLKTIESLMDDILDEYKNEVKTVESKFLNKMLQSFGIIAAIFAFIISVLGYSNGIFDIFNTVVKLNELNIWMSVIYLGCLSLALFLPVGFVSVLLILFVKKD